MGYAGSSLSLSTTAGRRSSVEAFDASNSSPHGDIPLMMAYIFGSNTKDYDCLFRTACQNPHHAIQYKTASKMILTTAKAIQK